MLKPLLPVVAGPTASGKTACAVALCRMLDGEVVSADSMQIYRGMEVLSAVPDEAERGGIPHHLMSCVDPSARFSANAYRDAANACIADIFRRGRQPVLCGGTGLYIDAVTRPMCFSMESDAALHASLMAEADQPGGKRALHERLKQVDPDSAARLHENDVRRVVRALEIYQLTGVTQAEHTRRDRQREGDYREVLFALDWPRDVLYSRIDARVDDMLRHGLVEEVKTLMADESRHPTAMQAIGYGQISAALLGGISMDEAVRLTKRDSRNLAKRQLTWFRRDPSVIWLPAQGRSAEELAQHMVDILHSQI